MSNITKFIIIILFSLISTGQLAANEKSAVINIEFLIQNSNIGKKLLKKIDDLNKKNLSFLEKKNQDLRKLEAEIKNKKNVISSENFENEVKNFKQKVQQFTDEKNLKVKEFNNFRSSELEMVLKLFNPIISNYMEENSINILIDTKNIFMASQSSNLTNDLLKIINEELK